REAILVMSAKGFGCVGVVDGANRLVGIVTDGDLRRHLSADVLSEPVDAVMTRSPKTVGAEALLGVAIEMLTSRGITALIVVDDDHRPVGIVHMHDLLRAGVA
ncbi:CBS domain-containing protein, partial [Mycobacterium tuberculosis]|nr:CBS domain-containing protein [Mycobacterium tuberculosis]